MNIFEREKLNRIEGFSMRKLNTILCQITEEDLPEVDSVIFDTILLTDDTKIRCIKNYYSTKNGDVPKKSKTNSTCAALQKFYGIRCQPYACINCHRDMLRAKENKLVKLKLTN